MFSGVLELLFDRIDKLLIFFFSGNDFFVSLTAPSFFFFVSFLQGLPNLVYDTLRRGWPLFRRAFIATSSFAFTNRTTGNGTFHLLPATPLEHLQLTLDLQVLLAELMVYVVVSRNIQIWLSWIVYCTQWLLGRFRHHSWMGGCVLCGVGFAEGVRDPRFLELCLMVVIFAHRSTLGTHKTVRLVERYREVRALACVWVTGMRRCGFSFKLLL